MEFVLNGDKWRIIEKRLSDGYFGLTDYKAQELSIEKTLFDTAKRKTLIHELVHVWLWEFGHNPQDDDKVFTVEDVCEIASNVSIFVNDIINQYYKTI